MKGNMGTGGLLKALPWLVQSSLNTFVTLIHKAGAARILWKCR